VKRIEVPRGRRPSYQQQSHRSEHWFVVAGEGVATLDGHRVPVCSLGARHSMETLKVTIALGCRTEPPGQATR
jgi:hypothetical protein